MKGLLMALLIAVSPVVVYAGTFSDDFNDGNFHGWQIRKPSRNFPVTVEIKNGYVVMDTMFKKNENRDFLGIKRASLELRAGNAESWNAYTLTCRIRISEVENALFSIDVRRSEGRFDLAAQQTMLIDPLFPGISVITAPPDAKFNPEKIRVEGDIHRGHFRILIKLRRWYPIKIVADGDNFAFYFDNNLLTEYEDKTAVPGTVRFYASSGMLVHLDDVVITGPSVPDLANRVSPKGHLTTIWGKIKMDSAELQHR